MKAATTKDRKVTVQKLSETMLDVGKTCVDNILTDRLRYVKVCASGKLKEEVLSHVRGATGQLYDSALKKIVHCIQKMRRSQRWLCRKIGKRSKLFKDVTFDVNKYVFHCEPYL